MKEWDLPTPLPGAEWQIDSGVERSERNVSIDNIARIARGLKVKAHVLLDDSAKL